MLQRGATGVCSWPAWHSQLLPTPALQLMMLPRQRTTRHSGTTHHYAALSSARACCGRPGWQTAPAPPRRPRPAPPRMALRRHQPPPLPPLAQLPPPPPAPVPPLRQLRRQHRHLPAAPAAPPRRPQTGPCAAAAPRGRAPQSPAATGRPARASHACKRGTRCMRDAGSSAVRARIHAAGTARMHVQAMRKLSPEASLTRAAITKPRTCWRC